VVGTRGTRELCCSPATQALAWPKRSCGTQRPARLLVPDSRPGRPLHRGVRHQVVRGLRPSSFWGLQVAPRNTSVSSQSGAGPLRCTGAFQRYFLAAKPTNSLSGDQKGRYAPCAPSISLGASRSKSWIQRCPTTPAPPVSVWSLGSPGRGFGPVPLLILPERRGFTSLKTHPAGSRPSHSISAGIGRAAMSSTGLGPL
jgi:hypothetical protein